MTRPPFMHQPKLDPRAREVALRKLKAGVKKDVDDLKTLCGVDVCVVLYEKPDAPPVVFPSHSEAVRLIQEYDDAKMVSRDPELDEKALHALNRMRYLTAKYQSREEELAALIKKRDELMMFKAEIDRKIKLDEEASEGKTREN